MLAQLFAMTLAAGLLIRRWTDRRILSITARRGVAGWLMGVGRISLGAGMAAGGSSLSGRTRLTDAKWRLIGDVGWSRGVGSIGMLSRLISGGDWLGLNSGVISMAGAGSGVGAGRGIVGVLVRALVSQASVE